MRIIVKEPLKNAVIQDIKCKYAIEVAEKYIKTLDVMSIDISQDRNFGIMAAEEGIMEINNQLELMQLQNNDNLSLMLHIKSGPERQKLLALTGTVIFIRVDDKDRVQDINDFDIHDAKKIVDFD